MPAIVDTILLFTAFLTFFDLSMISAPRPISAALSKTLVVAADLSLRFVAVAVITSNLLVFPSENARQHSIISSGNPNDMASTFLVPQGTIAMVASGLIGFNFEGEGKLDFF